VHALASLPDVRILVVVRAYPPEAFIQQEVEALARRGHEIHVLAHERRSWMAGASTRWPPVTYLPMQGGLRRMGQMLVLLVSCLSKRPVALSRTAMKLLSIHGFHRSFLGALHRVLPIVVYQPDVVHMAFPAVAERFRSSIPAVVAPILVSVRGSGSEVHADASVDDRHREVRLDALNSVDRVHVVSEATYEEVIRLGVPAERVSLIRNAVPLERFPRRDRKRKDVDELHLVSVGRIHWNKGYEYALEAIRRLLDKGVNVRYSIVGGGWREAWAPLHLARYQLGLEDRVAFVGPVDHSKVRGFLADADLFLLPSVTEGISTAVLEAMATELPVIVSDVGGMREAITDGVDGLLVPARDVDALKDAIERLAKDTQLRDELGKNARARVESQFDLERCIDDFEVLYRELVS
jgi:colanic acid/amylovoran biosynthesis glycosyltransferase